MTESTDYALLYAELGLDPGCSMDEFKQAYRRQVGRLHPDIHGAAADLTRLQRLNRLYSAAMDFQRVHGRFPGAPPAAPVPTRVVDPSRPPGRCPSDTSDFESPAYAPSDAETHDIPGHRLWRYLLPTLIVALTLLVLWMQ